MTDQTTATVPTPSANDVPPVSPAVVEAAPVVPAAPAAAISADAPAAPVSPQPEAQAPAADPSPLPSAAGVDAAATDAPAVSEPTSLLGEAGKKPEAAPAVEAKPDDKAAAPAADAPVEAKAEPIVYDFKIPEGVALADGERAELVNLFNEGKAQPEYAQKLLDRHYAEVKKVAESIRAEQFSEWNKTQDEWRGQVMADPELGGPRLQTTLNMAGTVLEQYGSDDLRKMLGYTGAGNHPAMVRFMHNIARALGEGRPVPAPPPVSQAIKTRADRLYGTKPNGAA